MRTGGILAGVLLAGTAVAGPLVVTNDRGGALHDRLVQMGELRVTETPVVITGRVCASSCTMLLGLPRVCVSPRTRFGFHGPSRNGRPLSSEHFDYFSRVMAQNYPAPVRRWFMDDARHSIRKPKWLTGAELIRLGVRACR